MNRLLCDLVPSKVAGGFPFSPPLPVVAVGTTIAYGIVGWVILGSTGGAALMSAACAICSSHHCALCPQYWTSSTM